MATILNVQTLIWLLNISYLLTVVNSDRITEKIYQKIDNGFSCFRRLNATHQIGCSCKHSLSLFSVSSNYLYRNNVLVKLSQPVSLEMWELSS